MENLNHYLSRIFYKSEIIYNSARGNILKRKATAYWYNKYQNFGDLITPWLLRKYGLIPVHSSYDSSALVATGSILQGMPENYSGYIIGSGLIRDTQKKFNNAKILAVRGKMTKSRINAPSSVVLGDPGLIVSKFLQVRQRKRYVLGLVPHLYDKLDDRIANICQKYKKDILNIDVQRKPMAVIKDIDKCEYILSSSLHGIVIADSLSIPNGWLFLSQVHSGKNFKFYDYASAINVKCNPINLNGEETLSELISLASRTINTDKLKEIQRGLDDSFNCFKNNIIN